MKRAHYAMFTSAIVWIGMVFYVIAFNTVARDLPLVSTIAQTLDGFPEEIRNPMFIFLWIAFLFGWIPLLMFAALFWFRSRVSA